MFSHKELSSLSCQICSNKNSALIPITTELVQICFNLNLLAIQCPRPVFLCCICQTYLRQAYMLKMRCLKANQYLENMDKDAEVHTIIGLCSPLTHSSLEQENIAPASTEIIQNEDLTLQKMHLIVAETVYKEEQEYDSEMSTNNTTNMIEPKIQEILSGKVIEDIMWKTRRNSEKDALMLHSNEQCHSEPSAGERKTSEEPDSDRDYSKDLHVKERFNTCRKTLTSGFSSYLHSRTHLAALHACQMPSDQKCSNVMHECPSCHKQFHTHLYCHNGNKQYECDICPRTFRHHIPFREHYATHNMRHKLKHNDKRTLNDISNEKSLGKKIKDKEPLNKLLIFDKVVECDKCHNSFSNKLDLKALFNNHDEPTLAKSVTSDESFVHRKYYEYRLTDGLNVNSTCKKFCSTKTDHPIDDIQKPFKCKTCDKSLSTKAALILHLRIHNKRNLEVGKRSDESDSELEYLKNLNVEKRFNCQICRKSVSTKAALILHSRIHNKLILANSNKTTEQAFVCNECQKIFSSKAALITHISIHDIPVAENVPNEESFPDEEYSPDHREELYECNTCQKTFSTKTTLISHLPIHEKTDLADIVISEESSSDEVLKDLVKKTFRCIACGKSVSTKAALTMHARIHDKRNLDGRDKSDSEMEYLKDPNIEKRFNCTTCGKTVSTKAALTLHSRIHNKPTLANSEKATVQSFVCNACQKTFSSKAALISHLSIHDIPEAKNGTSEQSCPNRNYSPGLLMGSLYECNTCQKSFSTKATLISHLLIHEKPQLVDSVISEESSSDEIYLKDLVKKAFRCTACGKSVSTKAALTLHSRIHYKPTLANSEKTTEQSFVCNACQKTFSSKAALISHLSIHDIPEAKNGTSEQSCPNRNYSPGLLMGSSYECNTCQKSFSTKATLISHLLIHEKPQLVDSVISEESSSDEIYLKDLVKKAFRCTACGKSVSTKAALTLHSRIHNKPTLANSEKTTEQSFVCNACQKTFSSKAALISHLSIHDIPEAKNGTSEQSCPNRNYSPGLLMGSSYECNTCQKSFSTKATLISHLLIHEKPQLVDSVISEESSSDEIYLKDLVKKAFRCTACGKSVSTKAALTLHSRIHNKPTLANSEKTTEQSFVCNACQKIFSSKTALILHISDHDIPVAGNVTNEKSFPNGQYSPDLTKEFYECNTCQITFSTKVTLLTHLLIHEKTDLADGVISEESSSDEILNDLVKKAFRCITCGKSVSTKAALTLHSRIHDKRNLDENEASDKSDSEMEYLKDPNIEKRFNCTTCGKAVSTKAALTLHARIHNKPILANSEKTTEQFFECNTCQKTFSSKAALISHLSIHDIPVAGNVTNEKSFPNGQYSPDLTKELYECNTCQKSFSTKATLISHLLIHEKPHLVDSVISEESSSDEVYLKDLVKKAFRCITCGKSVSSKDALILHSRIHIAPDAAESETNKKPMKESVECNTCQAIFSTKTDLISHWSIRENSKSETVEISLSDREHLEDVAIEPNNILKKSNKVNTFSDQDIFKKQLVIKIDKLSFHSKLSEKNTVSKMSDLNSRSGETNESKSIHIAKFQNYIGKRDTSKNIKEFSIKNHSNSHNQSIDERKVQNMNNEEQYICDKCQKSFDEKKELIAHISEHNCDKRFDCDTCKGSFSRKEDLMTHVKLHYATTSYPIDLKKKNSSDKDRPFECQMCHKCFKKKRNFNRHVKRHNDNYRPFTCEICQKSFKERRALQVHLRIHSNVKPYKCTLCTMSFRLKNHLKLHLGVHSDVKPFTCDICKKKFAIRHSFQRHIANHQNALSTIKNLWHCNICGKALRSRHRWKLHELGHSSTKPFKCEICDKSFVEIYKLTKHLKIHTKRKGYKCDFCPRVLFSQIGIKNHILTHTRPFQCDICKRGFQTEKTLKNHQCLDFLECDICRKQLGSKNSLIAHLKKHNDGQ